MTASEIGSLESCCSLRIVPAHPNEADPDRSAAATGTRGGDVRALLAFCPI
jgi:hypothetical protein